MFRLKFWMCWTGTFCFVAVCFAINAFLKKDGFQFISQSGFAVFQFLMFRRNWWLYIEQLDREQEEINNERRD